MKEKKKVKRSRKAGLKQKRPDPRRMYWGNPGTANAVEPTGWGYHSALDLLQKRIEDLAKRDKETAQKHQEEKRDLGMFHRIDAVKDVSKERTKRREAEEQRDAAVRFAEAQKQEAEKWKTTLNENHDQWGKVMTKKNHELEEMLLLVRNQEEKTKEVKKRLIVQSFINEANRVRAAREPTTYVHAAERARFLYPGVSPFRAITPRDPESYNVEMGIAQHQDQQLLPPPPTESVQTVDMHTGSSSRSTSAHSVEMTTEDTAPASTEETLPEPGKRRRPSSSSSHGSSSSHHQPKKHDHHREILLLENGPAESRM